MRVERRKEKQDGLTMEKQDLLPPDKKNWLGLLLRQAPSFFGDRNNGFLDLDPGPHECAREVIT